LKATSRRWFSSLPAKSITGWMMLNEKFILNYTSSKQQFKTEHHLERVKQKPDEPLREYII
jgi:hypothetical protein